MRRWAGHCYRCHRLTEIESRAGHAEQVLCDDCARKPHRPPSAAGLERPREPKATRPPETTPRSGRTIDLVPAAAIRSERVRWLWRDRIPLRGVAIVAGEKGLGKSILTNARFVAEVTRGTLAGELHGTPRDVALVSGEDDWRSVIKPRLMAHGADVSRVRRVVLTDENGDDALLTLPDDVRRLDAALADLRQAGHEVAALVIDPLGAFLSASIDSHRDASVRRAIAPLAALADRTNIAVVIVAHLTKDETTRLINRVGGSGAFVNAGRSYMVMARHPDDPDGEQGQERVLTLVATNWGRLAPSLHLRVETRKVDLDDGHREETAYLNLIGETDIGVDDLQRRDGGAGAESVEEAIAVALADGPRPARDVKKQVADEEECSQRTVERAARRMIETGGLAAARSGFPAVATWTLTAGTDSPVATRPDTPGCRNWESGATAGDSAPSGDSSDTSGVGVAHVAPVGPDVDLDAELDRLRAKRGADLDGGER